MKSTSQLYLAPIQGVTNEGYQTIYHDLFSGIDCYVAPFVKVGMQGKRKNRKKALLPERNEKIRLIPQILSNNVAEFLQFDQYLQDAGYQEFNWNLGCPMRMVTLKKRGAGLLPYPEQIEAMLDHIMPKIHCQMSVKVRLGLKHADELLTVLPILNRFPIQMLIIHPRLGQQAYAGQVDLQAFEECLRTAKHSVVYNGDIFNLESFRALQKRFPQIKHWMLGRGVLANPFLPAQIKGEDKDKSEKLEMIMRFHAAMAAQYEEKLSGPAHVLDKLLAIWFYLHHVFADGAALYRQLKKAKKYEVYKARLDHFYSTTPPLREHLNIVSEDFI
ncbi:tRNA-dihydrouridine synthase family protein [bacterium]|nr:tRNA-dihydrouridine synthase family protein [bacterium]